MKLCVKQLLDYTMKIAATETSKRITLTTLLEPDDWAVGLGELAVLVADDPVVDKTPPWPDGSLGTMVVDFPAPLWKALTVSLA